MTTDTTDQIIDLMRSSAHRAKFKGVDRRAIAKMSDHELALWQSEYPEGSPQYILAEHEWQRRLTVEQVKASRFAAFMGIFGAVIGAVIGAFITWLASK